MMNRTAGTITGVGILLMSVLAGFGIFVAVEGLVTPGNPARTATDMLASEGLFRLGIVSLVLVAALDVLVAWGLYHVFSPVSQAVSMLAATFRLVYAGVLMVAIGHLLGVLRLLDDGSEPGPGQLGAQVVDRVNAFTDVWTLGLFLFGLHLLVIGYLAYRSGYVPKVLGVLLSVAGLGYAVDTLGAVLSRGAWTDVSSFTFVGEFLLALWLVLRGRRLTTPPVGRPGEGIADHHEWLRSATPTRGT